MRDKNIRRVLIISHLWPKNPQSKNPMSGIYVYDQASEIAKKIETMVLVPLSVIPRIGEIKSFKGDILKNIKKRLSYSPDRGESIKYISFAGKYFDSISIASAILMHKKKDYNLMHCHTMFPDGLTGMILSIITGKPFIVTIHGSEIMFIDEHPIDRMLAKIILMRAKSVISVSGLMKEKILRLTKNKSNVSVIRNGIKEEFPIEEKEKMILFAGKLIPVKDPEMLIEAFSVFLKKNPDFKLVMAGDGILREKIQKKIRDLNIENRVELTGYLEREEIKRFFARASILAITSRSEGFPTVIYESMSSGTPIVSFDVGGVKEAVRNGENGFIVKKRTAEEFALFIDKAVKATWNRDNIRKEAEEYLWERLADKIIQAYK